MINGKKIIGIAASVAMIAGAAACGGSSSGTASNSASGNNSSAAASSASTASDACTEGEEVSLTVWAPSEDQTDDSSWLQTEEKAFEAANPNCKITWTNAAVGEDKAGATVKQDVSTAADVYLYANDQLGALVSAGAVGAFQGGALDQIKDHIDQSMIDTVTVDGSVYGVPFTANTWFMYYDSSVFTADDVKSLDTMLEKGKVSFPLENAWYVWSFYAGAGATLFGADGTDTAADPLADLGDNGAAVTQYLITLRNNSNFVLDSDSAGLSGLKDGSVNAVFSGTWDASNVQAALGANYAAAQPPTFNLNGTETQMRAFFGSKSVGYNPQSKSPKVAASLALFLGSTDAQKAHYEIRQTVPADKSLASDEAVAKDPAAIAQMNTVANASIAQPTVAAMTPFWDAVANFTTDIYNGGTTADNAEAQTQTFIDSLNKQMQEANADASAE